MTLTGLFNTVVSNGRTIDMVVFGAIALFFAWVFWRSAVSLVRYAWFPFPMRRHGFRLRAWWYRLYEGQIDGIDVEVRQIFGLLGNAPVKSPPWEVGWKITATSPHKDLPRFTVDHPQLGPIKFDGSKLTLELKRQKSWKPVLRAAQAAATLAGHANQGETIDLEQATPGQLPPARIAKVSRPR